MALSDPIVEPQETGMPANASSMVLGTLGLAIIAVTVLWRFAGPVVALAAVGVGWAAEVLTGARLGPSAVWLQSRKYDLILVDKDGRGWWLSRFLVALIVLPTPSVLGLVLARGVTVGWNARTVLVVLLILIGLLALGHGDWQTLLLITAVSGTLAVLALGASPGVQLGAVVTLAWFFLLGGLRLNIHQAGYKHGQSADTFPGALQRLTDVPGLLWMLGFLLIAVAAAVAGSRWLLA